MGVPVFLRATSPAAPVLTTGSTVFYWDGSLLVAFGLLALAVVAVGAAVPGADRPVGAIAGDAVAGAASGATAVQADSVELALILAFVWEERGWHRSHPPRGQGKGVCSHCQEHGTERRGRSGTRMLLFPRKQRGTYPDAGTALNAPSGSPVLGWPPSAPSRTRCHKSPRRRRTPAPSLRDSSRGGRAGPPFGCGGSPGKHDSCR